MQLRTEDRGVEIRRAIDNGPLLAGRFLLTGMKRLILFLVIANVASAGTSWTHRTVEGEGGGGNGDYYFYQSFRPKSGSDVMRVLKARAVYAFDPSSRTVTVADYLFSDGVHIRIAHASRKDANRLFEGEDVGMETVREYRIPFEITRGRMIKPKAGTKLSEPQQADLLNLVHVLAMQRCSAPVRQPDAAVRSGLNGN